MKKIVLAIVVLVFSFSMLVATPGQYDDVVEMMLKMEKVFLKFAEGADVMKSAPDAVQVITEFKEGMLALIPTINALDAKYPEMAELKDNPPAEIKVISDRIEKAGEGMAALVTSKFGPYMGDPAVQKAFMDLNTAMQPYQPSENKPEGEVPADK